jgi:hypothetical protein
MTFNSGGTNAIARALKVAAIDRQLEPADDSVLIFGQPLGVNLANWPVSFLSYLDEDGTECGTGGRTVMGVLCFGPFDDFGGSKGIRDPEFITPGVEGAGAVLAEDRRCGRPISWPPDHRSRARRAAI